MREGPQTVDHDGLTFNCRLDGALADDGAPWVMFANSMLTDHTVWDAQVAVLKDNHRILRYDQRGHGKTNVPANPCTIGQLGDDALALMNAFGIGSCTFVGLSMGVPTALHVVSQAPDRIARLVLSDGQSHTQPGGAATWQERIDHAVASGPEGLAAATVARWFGSSFIAAGGAEKVRAAAAAMKVVGYIACARALQDYDYADVLGRISVPTLITVGANDGNMPVSMKAMCDAIPGAVMHVIPDAGHIPNVEQADLFNRHLLDFLSKAGSA